MSSILVSLTRVYILRPLVVDIGSRTEIQSISFEPQTSTTKIRKSTWSPSNIGYSMIHEHASYLILNALQYLLYAIYSEHHEPSKVEVPETIRIRRFAYEKWVYFFEKFYVDGEEEIMMKRSSFIFFCLIDNLLQLFKVQSKFDPLMAP